MLQYSRTADVVQAEVAGSLIALDPQSAQFYEFNAVAARIWELLGDGPKTHDELVSTLLDEYEVSLQRCAANVAAFLAKAVDRGLITAVP